MSESASLTEALYAADDALLIALRSGDAESADAWARTRDSLLHRLAALVATEPEAARAAVAAARAATVRVCQAAELARDEVVAELETLRGVRLHLAQSAVPQRAEPRFVSHRA